MSREHEFEFWIQMSQAADLLNDSDGVWAAWDAMGRLGLDESEDAYSDYEFGDDSEIPF